MRQPFWPPARRMGHYSDAIAMAAMGAGDCWPAASATVRDDAAVGRSDRRGLTAPRAASAAGDQSFSGAADGGQRRDWLFEIRIGRRNERFEARRPIGGNHVP